MSEMKIDIEEASSILERISKNYAPESPECTTLKLAGQALHYVWDDQIRSKFRQWVHSMDGGLSEKQKAHLLSMGIEPGTGDSLL